MSRLYKRPRRKVVVLSIIGALVLAGSALAAFLIYTGLNGSASGNFTSSTSTQSAVTISNNGPAPDLQGPGDSQSVSLLITNNNPNAAETVASMTPTFTSTPSVCASHLSIAGVPGHGITGDVIPAGGTDNQPVIIAADASLPNTCLAGSWTVTFAGTTTP